MPKNRIKKQLLEILQEKKVSPFSIQEGRFRFGQLKDSVYYSDWTEESFLSDSGGKEMVTRSFNFNKLKQISLIALTALLILTVRAGWLQVAKGNHYYLLSEDNRLRSEVIEPKRGIIYDKDFNPLVRNKANFVLYLRPIDLPRNELERDELIREVSTFLANEVRGSAVNDSLSSDSGELTILADNDHFYQIKEALAKVKIGSLESYQPLFVQDNIDYEIALKLQLELANWPGVFLSNKIRREYLVSGTNGPEIATGSSLSHLLGYTGKINDKELATLGPQYSLIDYVGKVGLENYWETELKGKAGKKSIEVDALGRQKKVVSEVLAEDGHNLRLSLDVKLQQKIEEILKVQLEKLKLQKASIIITNPQNGTILALVSWPAYDNNAFAGGISQAQYSALLNDPSQPLFNRAISGEFPSGSTIKPIFAAGALQEGIINEKTSFLSTGGLRIGQWSFPDWRAGGHGITDVRRAIAFSVNTFFYYIGGGYGDFAGLGLDGLVKYARLFGLGESVGIDLPGERSGLVPTREWKREAKNETWYIGDTYHVSIGQGNVLVTPLQVASYTTALANGGTLYRPQLVSQILDGNNNLIREVEPEIIRADFIDSRNMEIIREGMRLTVTTGSARYLDYLPVSSAGKTGTAQWSSRNNTHAWYIGFAPYENPELALTILLEEGGEGSAVAVPIAYEILQWYFSQ